MTSKNFITNVCLGFESIEVASRLLYKNSSLTGILNEHRECTKNTTGPDSHAS